MDSLKNARDFGKQVQIIRSWQKISQSALSQMIGIPRSHLSRIESGANVPTLKIAMALCKALNIRLLLVIDSDILRQKEKIRNGTTEKEIFTDPAPPKLRKS